MSCPLTSFPGDATVPNQWKPSHHTIPRKLFLATSLEGGQGEGGRGVILGAYMYLAEKCPFLETDRLTMFNMPSCISEICVDISDRRFHGALMVQPGHRNANRSIRINVRWPSITLFMFGLYGVHLKIARVQISPSAIVARSPLPLVKP